MVGIPPHSLCCRKNQGRAAPSSLSDIAPAAQAADEAHALLSKQCRYRLAGEPPGALVRGPPDVTRGIDAPSKRLTQGKSTTRQADRTWCSLPWPLFSLPWPRLPLKSRSFNGTRNRPLRMPAHPPPRPRSNAPTIRRPVSLYAALLLRSRATATGVLLGFPIPSRRLSLPPRPAAAADERSGFRRHITLSCRVKEQELPPPAPLVLRPLPTVSHRPPLGFPPPETELRLHPHCPRAGLKSRRPQIVLACFLLCSWPSSSPFELLPLLYSPALISPLRSSPHCLFRCSVESTHQDHHHHHPYEFLLSPDILPTLSSRGHGLICHPFGWCSSHTPGCIAPSPPFAVTSTQPSVTVLGRHDVLLQPCASHRCSSSLSAS